MNDTIPVETVTVRSSTPVHLWIVGVVSLLWNLFGTVDFTLANIRYQPYISGFPPEVIQQMDAYPLWSVAAWACGVWGALAGSILLLFRSRLAVPAFALSLAGLAASTAYQVAAGIYGFSGAMAAMNLTIWVIAVLLLVYALRMRAHGSLR
jgi:hypothetical protein